MKSFTTTSAAALAALLPLVHGHGFVTSPNPRMPGSAMKAACGNQVEVNQQSDNYGNIQGELQVAASQSDYNAAECDIWLCKGYKFADNQDNIYSYTAGQTIDFTVDIRAPHTGIANVSVVDTASNTVIGDPLIYWSVYASTATGVTANETSFSVTLPDDLGSQCATAGDCVLQWYWYAESIDQTYESCIDFSLGGSSSSSSSSTSTSSSSTVVTSSSAAATTSSSAAAIETTSAAVETTSAAVETTTAQTTTAAIQAVTTFATQARQSSQPSTVTATSSSVASTLAIPTDSAQDTLDFVRSVFKYLVGSD
ncbi:putative chitin binding protein [Penicillium brasilianum]|uniref:Putative chitin binding protein n=1 Tax=Penicillium brasilianum TaxID=104259 RepID=A0A1S9RY39_PENBI|nr:putative chitin binding protein [Penicillium brasilianum]